MAEREHLTRRGDLLARLEWGKTGPGRYMVEGYDVQRHRDTGGTTWTITRPGSLSMLTKQYFGTMTEALEWVAAQVEARHG